MIDGMDSPPEEPTADARQSARGCRDMFSALVNEGFTENQALLLVGSALAAAVAESS